MSRVKYNITSVDLLQVCCILVLFSGLAVGGLIGLLVYLGILSFSTCLLASRDEVL